MSTRSTLRRAFGLVGLAVAATSLVAVPTTAIADPGATALVISEVYGGGGNAGATYTHDFIELYNPTTAPISLTGHAVEYFSSGGGSGGSTPLTGSVAAGGRYLVQEAVGTGGTTPLPTPDATGTLAMSGTNGSVALKNSGTTIDLVGYGTATLREGTAGAALTNTTAASRNASGADTDNNATISRPGLRPRRTPAARRRPTPRTPCSPTRRSPRSKAPVRPRRWWART